MRIRRMSGGQWPSESNIWLTVTMESEYLKFVIVLSLSVFNVLVQSFLSISHWDICNEQLHGDWYERKTRDIRFVDKIFRSMNKLKPSSSLCLNEYDVCSRGVYTSVSFFAAWAQCLGIHEPDLGFPSLYSSLEILCSAESMVLESHFRDSIPSFHDFCMFVISFASHPPEMISVLSAL